MRVGLWSNNLLDTDAALDDFFESCAQAGPEECFIHESTSAAVKQRVDKLLNKLRTEPVGVHKPLGPGENRHGIVDYALARGVIFNYLYVTHGGGKILTEALASLEQGNGSMIYAASRQRLTVNNLLKCSCPPGAPNLISTEYDVLAAIACGDTDGRNESVAELRAAYEEMAQTSSFGEVWFPRALCS